MKMRKSENAFSIKINPSLCRSTLLYGSLFLLCTCGLSVEGSIMELQLRDTCNDNDLKECALAADSLVKDPSLVFPDSQASLDRVCGTWDRFISCINNYTKKCYTVSERARFDDSFNKPILSMSTLCKDQTYRKDYLIYAPCIQKITTDGGYCGFQYNMLIDQISNGQVGLKQLCCARSKFKNCILTKTKDMCDPNKKGSLMERGRQVPYGSEKPLNVTAFSLQVLDKSLAFIAQQCSTFREEECQGVVDQNQVILRPNSKGPLNNAEQQQDEPLPSATNEKRQPASTSTNFQLPPASKQSASSSSNGKGNGVGNKNSQFANTANSIVRPTKVEFDSPQGSAQQKRDKPNQEMHSGAEGGKDGQGQGEGTGSRIFLNRNLTFILVLFTPLLILSPF